MSDNKTEQEMKQIKDGEWFAPIMSKHMMACCDCGLVHRMQFRVAGDQVQMRAYRARNYTAARRRKLKLNAHLKGER